MRSERPVQSTVRPWGGHRDSRVAVAEVAPGLWVHWKTEPWPDDRVEWVHVYRGRPLDRLPELPRLLADGLIAAAKRRRPASAWDSYGSDGLSVLR